MNVPSCKSVLKRLAFALCALAVAATPLAAAETLAVLSVKPTDQLLSDVEYLLEATGTNGIAQFVMPTVKSYLQHIDGKRPIGLVVSVDGPEFIPLGFLPVTDLNAFLEQIQEQVGPPIDAGDGVKEFQGPQQSVFVKEKDGWAFVGQTVESLKELPADPAKLLGGLDQDYDFAVRAHVKNIPEDYKQMAIGQIKQGLEQGLSQQDDPNAQRLAKSQMDQITQMIQETDVITFGWRIDPAGKQTRFDVSVAAVPNTRLAAQMQTAAQATTKFAGFLVPDAAISGNLAAVIPAEQMDQSLATLESIEKSALKEIDGDDDLPDENARDAAKKLVTTFVEIARSTIKTGKMDSCLSIILKPKAMTLVSANHVASGKDVEEAVKQLVEMAKNEPEISFSSVKFNAGEHAGVRFHTMSLPIPQEEYVRQVLGDQLDIVVGAGEDSAYVALGTNGMEYLKQMIDSSASSQGKKVEPFQATVALTPILEFADSIESNPIVSALAQSISQSNGKDRIQIRSTATENGITYQFIIEEGVLKLVGQGVQMNAAGGF